MKIKRTLLVHFIVLTIFSLISCGDDDACPNLDQFNFESNAIYDCRFTTDSNAFKEALMGTWAWDYAQVGFTLDVDCARNNGNHVEFKANNIISFTGSKEADLTWQALQHNAGPIRGLVKGFAPYSSIFNLCGSKLQFSEPGVADADRDIFSKE